MNDKTIQEGVLRLWRALDHRKPPPLCDGTGFIAHGTAPLCGGRGSIPVVCVDDAPVVVGDTAMVAGGAVECPGCAKCAPGLQCRGCEACTKTPAAQAVKTHCGGFGLSIGCPVCGKRFGRN